MNKYLEKIIKIAEERKIPLTTLCENTGLAKNTIANWKRGSDPSMEKVIRIIKYLGISADELFEIYDKKVSSFGGDYMEFTEKILEIIQDRKITAHQLEEETELAHSTISSWKRGTTPTIDKAIKVIKYLNLSADEIFGIKRIDNDDFETDTFLNEINNLTKNLSEYQKGKIVTFVKMIVDEME